MSTLRWISVAFLCIILCTSTSLSQWAQTTGPSGANIHALAFAGTDLYAGTWTGIFRSTNEGATWTEANGGLPFSDVPGIIASGTTIFAAVSYDGVYKSTNAGGTWTPANTGIPENEMLVSLAVSGTDVYLVANQNIYRSTNSGASWAMISGSVVGAVFNTLLCSGPDLYIGSHGRGVYRSTNLGGSWTQINTGLTDTYVKAFATIGTYLFAGTLGGVFRSSDSGTNWVAVNTGLTGLEVHSLVVKGTDLFAGTATGMFRSTDNGANWTQINTGLTRLNVLAVATSGTKIFAGTYLGGVFSSSNNGSSWTQVGTGLRNTYVTSLAVVGSSVYATHEGGLAFTTDKGLHWTPNSTIPTTRLISAVTTSGPYLIAGTGYGGMYRSSDNGTTWIVDNTFSSVWVSVLATSGTNLFAGTDYGRVYRSTDNGVSWTQVRSSGGADVSVPAIAASGTNTFAAVTNNAYYQGGGVIRSTDGGTSWTKVGLNNTTVYALAFCGGYLLAGTEAGMFRSSDNGSSWTGTNAGLTDSIARSFAVVGTELFAACRTSVARSTNNGATWTSFSEGLPEETVRGLVATGTTLYAGTWGFGVWSRDLSGLLTGDLVLTLLDAENWGPTGPSGRVELYDTHGVQVAAGRANGSSVVTLNGIPAGSGYYYRVYSSRVTAWGEQFWGEKTGITILPNQVTSDTHIHNTPYMPGIFVYIDATNELLADSALRPVLPGTRMRVELQIKNPAYDGAQAVTAHGELYLDRDRTDPYELKLVGTEQSYAIGTTKTVVFTFDAPSGEGGYALTSGAFASSARYPMMLADGGAWHDAAFRVVSSSPTLLSPADASTGIPTSVVLRWTRPVATTQAQLQIATDSTFVTGMVLNDTTLADTMRSISGLQYARKYFWRVRGKALGVSGPWSASWSFRTSESDPSVPKLIAPAAMMTGLDTSVTLQWTRPAGASSFHVQVGEDSTFTSGVILADYPTADTFAVLHSLSFLKSYWWHVNAYNPQTGISAYSETRKFATGMPLPGIVGLIQPAQNAVVNADTLRLHWRSSGPAVNRYGLEYSIDSTFTIKAMDTLLTDTTTVLRGMLKSTQYYWRVRAHNLQGWGPYSSIWRFSRSALAVHSPQQAMPDEWVLSQNYPNPFNPSTSVTIGMPVRAHVRLRVFDPLGAEVAVLIDAELAAGYHTVTFNATGFPSGVYFYRLEGGSFRATRKLLLVR